MGVVPVLLQGFTLHSEDGNAPGGDRRSCVILGGEDVAGGPAHFSAQLHQGLDQNRGLDRHVQGASNAGALEGFSLPYFSRNAIRPGISVSAMSSSLRRNRPD